MYAINLHTVFLEFRNSNTSLNFERLSCCCHKIHSSTWLHLSDSHWAPLENLRGESSNIGSNEHGNHANILVSRLWTFRSWNFCRIVSICQTSANKVLKNFSSPFSTLNVRSVAEERFSHILDGKNRVERLRGAFFLHCRFFTLTFDSEKNQGNKTHHQTTIQSVEGFFLFVTVTSRRAGEIF